MATKRAREERVKEDKERRYGLAVKSLRNFPLIAIGISIVFLMLFLLKFSQIYNSSAKIDEITYTGMQLLFATISFSFESPNTSFGNINIYNFHTPTQTQLTGIFVLISAIFAVAVIGLSIWAVIGKKPIFNIISAILLFLNFVLLMLTFIITLTSPIMIKYQCNLAVCSLHSLAIIPAIIAAIGAAISAIASVKYFKAKKILK